MLLESERKTRNKIARLFAQTIDPIVKDHFAVSQEPAVTSRLGQAIENLNGRTRGGYKIHAISQDVPDRGKGSLEKKLGADLYVGFRVSGEPSDTMKGLLIQSKWDGPLPPEEFKKLQNQARKIHTKTGEGSFVWRYSHKGVSAVSASQVIGANPDTYPHLVSQDTAAHFRSVLDCTAGDLELASEEIFSSRSALLKFLKELAAKTGVAITASKDD